MNKETLKALKDSIERWKRIARGTSSIHADCPLCNLFVIRTGKCYGCPVRERTKKDSCEGTPYYEVYNLVSMNADGRARSKDARRAANKEIKFLRSLLP